VFEFVRLVLSSLDCCSGRLAGATHAAGALKTANHSREERGADRKSAQCDSVKKGDGTGGNGDDGGGGENRVEGKAADSTALWGARSFSLATQLYPYRRLREREREREE
jgi:hypothetical protein